jgi:CubicO group peptidase (beta-lactamase class C family)
MGIGLAAPASRVTAAGPLDEETRTAIVEYVTTGLDALDVPGAALVIVDADGEVLSEAFGEADGAGRPVTPDTPFRVASLSKELTGLAVMQLVEAGALELDATLNRYLAWWPGPGDPIGEITIRDLLAHTSGWGPREGSLPLTEEGMDDGAAERNARRLAGTRLAHARGQFEYANANYDLLGYIAGVVSGTSFEEYLRDNVLAPLQMSHTHLADDAAKADGVAAGHQPFFGLTIDWDVPFRRAALPSASVVSSARDLGRVLRAHLGGGTYEGTTLIEQASERELRRPLVEPFAGSGYGWGWWSYPLYEAGTRTAGDSPRYQAPIILEHSGSLPGFASELVLMPEAGYGFALLMNRNDEVAPSRFYQLQIGIALLLIGEEPPPLASYDDPLRSLARPIAIGVPLLQLAGIIVALRRLQRWRAAPPPDRRTGGWRLRHLGLPLLVDIGAPVALWWLYFDTAGMLPIDYLRILPMNPDIGLSLAVVAFLGIGWGAVRTWLTWRVASAPVNLGAGVT